MFLGTPRSLQSNMVAVGRQEIKSQHPVGVRAGRSLISLLSGPDSTNDRFYTAMRRHKMAPGTSGKEWGSETGMGRKISQ